MSLQSTDQIADLITRIRNAVMVGKNEILVTVTAEDGSKSIYTIYATKKSDICVVNSINVKGYNLVIANDPH